MTVEDKHGPMTGRPPSVSTEEVVTAVALHPEPVVTASDVKEKLGLTQEGALARLKALVDQGYLKQKRPGGSALVFWLSDEGRALLSRQHTGSTGDVPNDSA